MKKQSSLWCVLSLAAPLLVMPHGAGAQQFAATQQRNDVPGCYSHAKLNPTLAAAGADRELFVVIDGTFSPDDKIKQMVRDKVQRFIQPGDRVNVISFSAMVSDHYTDLKFTGQLDTDIKDRDDVAKKSLQVFDHCLKKQQNFARKKIDLALVDSYRKDQILPKTEILNNLAQIVGPKVANSTADRKVVLLVSDLFENSDVTSFYSNNQIRVIGVDAEMAKIEASGLVTDFAGAEIYIAGAGWLEPEYRGFRGSKVMVPLKKFWQSYFHSSNATVKGFGQPMLMEDL